MDCNEARRLLDAHLDGELEVVRDLELNAHLRTCPDCARLAENARARRVALHESLPRFAAPALLAQKIRAALPAPAPVAVARAKIVFPLWQVSGLAASVALALLGGFAWGNARSHSNLLIDEAVADHVRSLQASHLTDVVSSDQHTVKPWFAGKLDFSPPVIDLAAAGFPLAGGRLEQLDGRPAAALVFRRRQHTINLFVWPANVTSIASARSERNGYRVAAWSQEGFNFLAVSEIPAAELGQFADSFRAGQH
jgi:anti-sigma factor RsiW